MDDFVKSKYSTKDKVKELSPPDDIPFEPDQSHRMVGENKSQHDGNLEEGVYKLDDNIEPEDIPQQKQNEKVEPGEELFSPKVINVSEVRKRKQASVHSERRYPRRRVFQVSKSVKTFLAVTLALGIIGFAVYFLQNNYLKLSNYSVEWSRDVSKGSFVGYERFRGSLVKYSKDAAIYLDKEGKELWTVAYEMSNPFAVANGDYIAIADKQKNKIIIFDKDGRVAEIHTINPISRFVLTKYGVVATIEEDIASTYINFYNRDGRQLQVTVKSKMSGNGYPTDLSISQDGKLLMVGFGYIEGGKLKGRVVFYDFADASVGTDNRVLAGFDEEFKDSLIGRVKFVNEKNAFVVSNNGVSFFKINRKKPTLSKNYTFEEEILSISNSDKYVAVITDRKEEGKMKTLTVYNPSGSTVFIKKFEKNFRKFDIDGDYFYLYTDRDCTIYNQLGTEKFSKTLDFDISIISKTNEMNRFIVTGPSQMKCIQLK